MLPPLRRLSGRSLSTAASRPSWAMLYRISTAEESTRGASLSLATPPSASRLSIPRHAFNLGALPANTDLDSVNVFGSGVLAASGDGLLLLTTFTGRARAFSMFHMPRPAEAPFEVLDHARLACSPTAFVRFVCNPITGQLFCLPSFDGMEKASSAGTGLVTQAGGDGPPKRYAAAQLSEVDGGASFVLRRFSSETGQWDKLVLPSPLPPGRRMRMNHEVLAFEGRLLWVDVSWGAVAVDPFSDRPWLCPVELPEGSMLPAQQSEAEMRQLVKHRRMGVSDGRLRYAEVSKEAPFRIKSFTLDDETGRWTLEHQVSLATLMRNAKEMPLIGAIDPLNTDLLYLITGGANVSVVDMRWKRIVKSSALGDGVDPSKCSSSFFLPCSLPSFLRTSVIPGIAHFS